MQVTVKLATREGAAHISGILAGFTLLAKRGELTLRVLDEEPAVPRRYIRKAAAAGSELLRYLSGFAAGSGAQRKEPPEAVGAFHPLLSAGL